MWSAATDPHFGDPGELVAAFCGDSAVERLAAWLRSARPSWMDQAECARAEHAGVEFIQSGRGRSQVADAVAICRRCPVIEACAEYAAQFRPGELHGVWAGRSALERAGRGFAAERVPTPGDLAIPVFSLSKNRGYPDASP